MPEAICTYGHLPVDRTVYTAIPNAGIAKISDRPHFSAPCVRGNDNGATSENRRGFLGQACLEADLTIPLDVEHLPMSKGPIHGAEAELKPWDSLQ